MKPVNLIIGLISKDIDLFDELKLVLSKKFSQVDFESQIFDFIHTSYYQEELGKDLKRKFFSFKELIKEDELVDVKLYTLGLEDEFSIIDKKGIKKRRINIDPGYVSLSKLILATRKDYYHRIYIRDGIYQEVTLYYRRKEGFVAFPWTYPDYKTYEYRNTFNKIREIYKRKLDSFLKKE
jgi:hypothetical protein